MNVNLNLTRKWRSATFDQVVGQELSIRMLKNSLYLNHFFPVYLFSGQRGCGKTSTARIFAKAINCEGLTAFQKNPRTSLLPCLICSSCKAMAASNHPDFIEMDAASHTGVDNVRQIIDAASFMPLLGSKKIYLIDEAHMLSKAAFNAFLKILEEPPASVLFILATTDPQKIIETVRSRSFQLLFKPVSAEPLQQHLKKICDAESIGYDDAGLQLIIKETDGSVRDAINLLEQVRFARPMISVESVLSVLGFLADHYFLRMLEQLLAGDQQGLLQLIADIDLTQYSAEFIYKRFGQLLRACMWLKHNVPLSEFEDHHEELCALIADVAVEEFQEMLATLYEQEPLFVRTTTQHTFLEMVLLQMVTGKKKSPLTESKKKTLTKPVAHQPSEEPVVALPVSEQVSSDDLWLQVLGALEHSEPMVHSVFKRVVAVVVNDATITIQCGQELQFFNDIIQNNQSAWSSVINETYGKVLTPVVEFVERSLDTPVVVPERRQTSEPAVVSVPKKVAASTSQIVNKPMNSSYQKRGVVSSKESPIDVSDQEKWHKTNSILRAFPGSTVTEIRQESHE